MCRIPRPSLEPTDSGVYPTASVQAAAQFPVRSRSLVLLPLSWGTPDMPLGDPAGCTSHYKQDPGTEEQRLHNPQEPGPYMPRWALICQIVPLPLQPCCRPWGSGMPQLKGYSGTFEFPPGGTPSHLISGSTAALRHGSGAWGLELLRDHYRAREGEGGSHTIWGFGASEEEPAFQAKCDGSKPQPGP